jgi:hypothetical protein
MHSRRRYGYYGGDSTSVAADIGSDVVSITSAWKAFAAVRSSGKVVTW